MPATGLTFRDLRNAILFAALVFLVIVFIRDIVDVILMFSVALLLIATLSPVVTWLNKRGLPRWLGTLTLTLVFLGLLFTLFYFIAPVAVKQFGQLVRDAPVLFAKINRWLAGVSSHFGAARPLRIDPGAIANYTTPLLGGLAAVTSSLVTIIAAAIAIFITTVYTLINPEPLANGILSSVAPEYRQRSASAAQRVGVQVLAWAKGTLFAMLTIFTLTYVALLILGIKQALLFAVIAGILEVIPVLGPILGGVLPTLTALAMRPILALWVVLAFVLIQQFENHILIPLVMSRQIRLHPVTVIFFVFIMGALYGIVGVFLATPAAVVAGVLYDELYLCEYRKQCEVTPEERDMQERQVREAKVEGTQQAMDRERAQQEHAEEGNETE